MKHIKEKNKKLSTKALFLLAIVILTAIICITLAKYVSNLVTSDSSRVAAIPTIEILKDNDGSVGTEVLPIKLNDIYPGSTTNETNFYVRVKNREVSIKYTVSVDEETTKNQPVTYSISLNTEYTVQAGSGTEYTVQAGSGDVIKGPFKIKADWPITQEEKNKDTRLAAYSDEIDWVVIKVNWEQVHT